MFSFKFATWTNKDGTQFGIGLSLLKVWTPIFIVLPFVLLAVFGYHYDILLMSRWNFVWIFASWWVPPILSGLWAGLRYFVFLLTYTEQYWTQE